MKKLLSALLMLVSVTALAQNKTYYINQNTPENGGGNDANSGLSPALAWKTIAKANSTSFKAGDKILLFSDGSWHGGNFVFGTDDTGTPANPITVSKYGPNAVANVWCDGVQGVYAGETASIIIKNINFYGGRTFGGANTANGINFYTGASTNYKSTITIDSCRLEGFGMQGILIQSWNNVDANQKGFSDITITNTIIVNCGRAGINIGAFGDFGHAFMHNNIVIRNVRATGNAGSNGFTEYATGNGIVVSSASNALIENCVADDNGALNSTLGVGIAGIWFYNVNGGLIQNCESFGNFAGQNADGNGFGIDGGCQNCTIQYCYSHDNEGAGYGLFEYGSVNPHTNNTIRYNISQNDGRKNAFGAFKVWGVNNSHKVTNDNVYGNSVYVNDQNLVDINEPPVGLRILGNHIQNVKFMNNAFYMDNNLDFTRSVSLINQPLNILPGEVLMLNNMYHNAGGGSKFSWGNLYNTLTDFRNGTLQEKSGETNYGYALNPGFSAAGTAPQLAATFNNSASNQAIPLPSTGASLSTLTQYKLTTSAEAKTKGINLNTMFGINVGATDYFKGSLAGVMSFDIGAHQSNAVLPLSSLQNFDIKVEATGNKLRWTLNTLTNLSGFEVESSTDGINFTKITYIPASSSLQYTFFDALVAKTTYYRLKGIDTNGETWSPNVKVANRTVVEGLSIFPNPLADVANISLNWSKKEIVKIFIFNSSGKLEITKSIVLNEGNNTIVLSEMSKLPSGVYLLNVSGLQNSLSKTVIKQ
ncbi:MAG: T9SS C-terminal target domain-containing protein [Sphingobacteriales bacterium]|nr:MAG: T9SS C-terminal target domain-containing protein [Sphingobacteriales bacterium]